MSEVFDLNLKFEDLALSPELLQGLAEKGFEHPTHTQSQLIPPILEGFDTLGQAKTGSGKTAAFGLPIVQHCDPELPSQALILAPTRELALQIVRELNELAKHTNIEATSVIGGEKYGGQIKKLQDGAQIIVGTPGRVADFYDKKLIRFDKLRFVALDEIDRMLDIGFRDEIKKLLSRIKNEHQTIFVSATISPEIEKLARQFMKSDAKHITIESKSLTVQAVQQYHLPVQPWDKRRLLLHLIQHEEPALTVVFCRTKATVHELAKYLQKKNVEAYEIHADLPQSKRNRIMKRLRAGNLEVLVASDLAARGLDIDGITHIINYDLPDDTEVYVHRIGRTARAGREGTAWSFVTPDQGQKLTEIEKLTGVLIEKLDYPGFKPKPRPDDWQDIATSPHSAPKSQVARSSRAVFQEKNGNIDPSKFPGGVVPKGPPRKRLGSRLRTKRS